MKNFQYAQPRTEEEAVALLAETGQDAVVLAGGTDLVGLMKKSVVRPDRVVNIAEIPSLQGIDLDPQGNTWVGAAVHLDEFLGDSSTDAYSAVKQVIQGISSLQLQCQGTLVGELLRRPNCWYFRSGNGLLANNGQLVIDGANRFHAILDNRGPAKFVNASRLAPALIALDAKVRLVGPESSETFIDLVDLYQTPTSEGQSENVLEKGQLVTHVVIPPHGKRISASYEVRHGEGPDPPLAASAVSVSMRAGLVEDASIVLGHVAPTPWVASGAAEGLRGRPLNEATATSAGVEAVAGARALSENEYKIQLAQVAVKRAILRAAGIETGGLDRPMPQQPAQPETESTPFV